MAITSMITGVLLATSAPSATEVWQQCIDSTTTNVEWGGCGVNYLSDLDDELNAAWKKANASLDDKQSRTQLLDEQRAWLKFRDASCQIFANGAFGREGQVLHFASCRGEILKARIADLNAIFQLTHQDAN